MHPESHSSECLVHPHQQTPITVDPKLQRRDLPRSESRILALRVAPASPYVHGGVRGGWREAPVYRSMRVHVPAAAVGPWAVAAIGAGSGCESAPSSCRRWRRGQARRAGRSAPGEAAGAYRTRSCDPPWHTAGGRGGLVCYLAMGTRTPGSSQACAAVGSSESPSSGPVASSAGPAASPMASPAGAVGLISAVAAS